jgi:hypothetical protein
MLWYENQTPGLGLEFLRAVDARFESIQRNAAQYPVVYRDVRRALLRRFPYAVFYRVEPGLITVLACVHSRSNPTRWKERT